MSCPICQKPKNGSCGAGWIEGLEFDLDAVDESGNKDCSAAVCKSCGTLPLMIDSCGVYLCTKHKDACVAIWIEKVCAIAKEHPLIGKALLGALSKKRK